MVNQKQCSISVGKDLALFSDIFRRRQWHPTPVLLPGKSHGWRSLVGCSPRGRKESDTTERLHFHFSLSCIGEGNGNPLQCSCLENPRDGGAWWASVYGVAQSQTQLKWLSSSSSSSSSSRDILKDIKNTGVVALTIFPFNSPAQFHYKPSVSQRMIVEYGKVSPSCSCRGCYHISTEVDQYGLWNMESAYRTGKCCPPTSPQFLSGKKIKSSLDSSG